MPNVRVVPKAEAQVMRRQKTPGIRRQRMNQFDEYVRVLLDNPDQAVVYEELDEDPLKFVITLRGAFRRAGYPNAMVRKMRARDEVRAWLADPGDEAPASAPRSDEQEGVVQPPAEPGATGGTPRRRRTRTAS
jgi:hypothetical protein